MAPEPDIFSEGESSPDTLANLGPLRTLAGAGVGNAGQDVHPQASGPESDRYSETLRFDAVDAQANGPQVLYGLRYHQHVLKPGEDATFHDQVGYLNWEPATGLITMSLAIPRAQVALAGGYATANSTSFVLRAERGSPVFGITSSPFLDEHFATTEWVIKVFIDGPDLWHYEQTTTLQVGGVPFAHTDANTLQRIEAAQPNPLSR